MYSLYINYQVSKQESIRKTETLQTGGKQN